jgi:hypothetical protein
MGSPQDRCPEHLDVHPETLKAQGMRCVALWVPDTRRPEFANEIRRQLALTEAGLDDQDDLSFLEQVADWSD